MRPKLRAMERLLFLWDDLDDALGAARHVLGATWRELCGGLRPAPAVGAQAEPPPALK